MLEALVDACRPNDLWEDAVFVINTLLVWGGMRRGAEEEELLVSGERLFHENDEINL